MNECTGTTQDKDFFRITLFPQDYFYPNENWKSGEHIPSMKNAIIAH